MRREERVTVQGPVKEQQPDGMSHRGVTLLLLPTEIRQFGAPLTRGNKPPPAGLRRHRPNGTAALVVRCTREQPMSAERRRPTVLRAPSPEAEEYKRLVYPRPSRRTHRPRAETASKREVFWAGNPRDGAGKRRWGFPGRERGGGIDGGCHPPCSSGFWCIHS